MTYAIHLMTRYKILGESISGRGAITVNAAARWQAARTHAPGFRDKRDRR